MTNVKTLTRRLRDKIRPPTKAARSQDQVHITRVSSQDNHITTKTLTRQTITRQDKSSPTKTGQIPNKDYSRTIDVNSQQMNRQIIGRDKKRLDKDLTKTRQRPSTTRQTVDETKADNKTIPKTRQDYTTQNKTTQDKTRQDKTRQDRTRQGKTTRRQQKTRQDKTRQKEEKEKDL